MNESKKESKVLHITHSGELLIWLIVVLIIISLSSMGLIFKEKNDENDYQIFLQDVDGLIVGSPVRMMGIEVGHVTKIKPTNTEVYVKFILTNPDVYIPQGTRVTVEFSGLAGSKSLELYLPDKNTYIENSTPVIEVMPPKRLHDALGLLNDMFKKLSTIIYSTSSFGSKLEENGLMPSGSVINNTESFKDFLDFSDEFLEQSNKKATDIRNSLEGLKNGK